MKYNYIELNNISSVNKLNTLCVYKINKSICKYQKNKYIPMRKTMAPNLFKSDYKNNSGTS